jgi:serine/threonine-protein kinase RsbW
MSFKLDKKILNSGTLAKLSIPANITYLTALQGLTKTIFSWFHFSAEQLQNIELIVEEAFVSVIENSFEPDEYGTVNYSISYHPGKLIISFEDKGLPVDVEKLEHQESSALSLLLIKHLADEFKFVNLGKDGKRLEIIKNLPIEIIEDSLVPSEEQPLTEVAPASPDEVLSFRMMEPKDAINIARLAYRAYGYTYASVAYMPEKIKEYMEFGIFESCIAINSNDEIIGHLGLFYDKPGSKAPDSAMAIVDPRYRGHKLFKRLKLKAVEHGKDIGLYGLYSESVTIHPYTQKGNISLGAKEIGSFIAFTSERISFKKINDEGLSQRQAVVLFYLKINEEPERQVFLPESYEAILKEIYTNLNLNRIFKTVKTYNMIAELSGSSVIEISIKPDFNSAVIAIENFGVDILHLIRNNLKELCMKKIDTIYLELPMSNPQTMYLTPEFREMGFFFGGVIPEFRNGDILKLQYLNNIYIDPSKINTASDFGRKLLNYILTDREKVNR